MERRPEPFQRGGGTGVRLGGGVAMVATAGYAGLLSGPVVIGAIAESASLKIGIASFILCVGVAAVAARSLRA